MNLDVSYKIALVRAPPLSLLTTLLMHSGALKNPSNQTLKLNGPLIFDLQKQQNFLKNHENKWSIHDFPIKQKYQKNR